MNVCDRAFSCHALYKFPCTRHLFQNKSKEKKRKGFSLFFLRLCCTCYSQDLSPPLILFSPPSCFFSSQSLPLLSQATEGACGLEKTFSKSVASPCCREGLARRRSVVRCLRRLLNMAKILPAIIAQFSCVCGAIFCGKCSKTVYFLTD